MGTVTTSTEKLNNIMSAFIDVIWQNIYEDKSTMPASLKQQLIEDSRIRNNIYDWANSGREGAWIMADYASPQQDGFYKAKDEDGKEGQFHFIFGKWHSVNNKKVIKWFDTRLNKKPCASCKVHEHEKDLLKEELKGLRKENYDLKRDIEFRLTHIIVRDEVLLAFEKANSEIERLKQLLSCKEAQSLESEIRELHPH
jgi:hypothetical protein